MNYLRATFLWHEKATLLVVFKGMFIKIPGLLTHSHVCLGPMVFVD